MGFHYRVIFALTLYFFALGGTASAAYQLLGNSDGLPYDWDGTYANRYMAETPGEYQFDYGNEASVTFTLPWSFPCNGLTYTQITANADGTVRIGDVGGPVVTAWNTDLSSYFYGGIFVQHKTDPDRVVIEWRTETQAAEGYARLNAFEVILSKTGGIQVDYAGFDPESAGDEGSGLTLSGQPTISISATSPTGLVTALGGTSHLFLDDPYGDPDGDGLDNFAEYLAGTDSSNPDSDGDGVPDGEDVSPTETLAVYVSPTMINSDEKRTINLRVDDLGTPGTSIIVRQAVDFNENGVFESGEPVVRIFVLTDGVASSNPNITGDEDGVADGAITTTLSYFNARDIYHVPAKYVFSVDAGPVSAEAQFSIQPAIELQTISGVVTDGLNPVPGALIRITDKWDRPYGFAVADIAGRYLIDLENPGEYRLTPMAYGMVANKSETPLVNLSSGQSLVAVNLVLYPGAHQLSGKVVDETTLTGIEGIWVIAESPDQLGLAISNPAGEYTFSLPSGDYKVNVSPHEGPEPAFKGYLTLPGQTIPLSGDLTGIDLSLPRATILAGGRVTNDLGEGVSGVPVTAVSFDGRMAAFSTTDSLGDYTLGLIPGSGWTIGVLEQMDHVGTRLADLDITGSVSGKDISLRDVSAWINGSVQDAEGAPISGLKISESTAGGFYQNTSTVDDGSFLLGAFPETWQIFADTQSAGCASVPSQQTTLVSGQTAVVTFADIPCSLAVPSISVPASSSTGSYLVSWDPSPISGATYRLEEATDSSFTAGLRTVVSNTTSLSAQISGRLAGLTYYYRVRAEKDGLFSEWVAGANGCTVTASSIAPSFDSTPPLTAEVGTFYTYDADADGNPDPTYSLDEAPAGMTINSTSGLVEWTPNTVGNFGVIVRAANDDKCWGRTKSTP